jgi:hypothetical protein
MNFQGVIIGAGTFIIIGIFHPIVIKAEFHFGTRVWPAFLLLGLSSIGASLFLPNSTVAIILGVLGFSSLWSIREMFEQ